MPTRSDASERNADTQWRTRKTLGGLALVAAVLLARAVLDQKAMAAAFVQAVVAEVGAGMLAIAWSDPRGAAPTPRALMRRALDGCVWGTALAVLALLATLGFALPRGPDGASALGLGFSVLGAVALAIRDELLVRGIVLKVTQGVPAAGVRIAACALADAAFRFGLGEQGAVALLVGGVQGALFASLWLLDRGAWVACAAHATSIVLREAFDGGAVLTVSLAKSWAFPTGGLGSSAAWLGASAALLIVALWRLRRAGTHIWVSPARWAWHSPPS